MIVTVKIIQGEECRVEVTTSSPVSFVKQLVSQVLHIPVDQQRLVFKGKTLSDSLSLADYNIVDGTKLHLVVKKTDEEPKLSSKLWDDLNKHLLQHFSASDAAAVLERFKQDFQDGVNNLSLDDIERLALSSSYIEQNAGSSASTSGS